MTKVMNYRNDTVIIVVENATEREQELITTAKRIEANVGEEVDEKALMFANFKSVRKRTIPAPPVGMKVPSPEEIKQIVEDTKARMKDIIEHPEKHENDLRDDLSDFITIYDPADE